MIGGVPMSAGNTSKMEILRTKGEMLIGLPAASGIANPSWVNASRFAVSFPSSTWSCSALFLLGGFERERRKQADTVPLAAGRGDEFDTAGFVTSFQGGLDSKDRAPTSDPLALFEPCQRCPTNVSGLRQLGLIPPHQRPPRPDLPRRRQGVLVAHDRPIRFEQVTR